MANPRHLALLQQGTSAWNAWRRKNKRVRPDLSAEAASDFEHQVALLAAAVVNEVMPGRAPPDEAGLSGRELASVDLHGGNLRGVNLSRANLMLADLLDVPGLLEIRLGAEALALQECDRFACGDGCPCRPAGGTQGA